MMDLFSQTTPSILRREFPLVVFSILTFVLLPIIYTDSTMDPEYSPKSLMVSGIILAFSVYLLFQPDSEITTDRFVVRIFLFISAMLLWTAASISLSVNHGDALTEWFRLVSIYCLLPVAFFLFRKSGSTLIILSRASAIAVFAVSAGGFIQLYDAFQIYLEGKWMDMNLTVNSYFANKNFFSEALIMLFPFQLAGILVNRKFWKSIILLSLALSLFFIFILQSISAWIAIGIGLIFYFLLSRKYKTMPGLRSTKWIVAITIPLFVLFSFFYFKYTSQHKFILTKVERTLEYFIEPALLDTTRPENNNSVFERLILWRNSLRMIGDNPIFGAGLNNWKILNPAYGVGGTDYTNSGFVNYEHPHNDYLLIWSEQGPIGIALYIIVFFTIIKIGIGRIRNADADERKTLILFLCGIVAFMTMSLFAYPRSRIFPMVMLMLLIAYVFSRENSGELKIKLRVVAFIVLIVSIFSTMTAFVKFKCDVHSKNLVVAQLKKNFARMVRETEKAYSWLAPLDLTATPIHWYEGMAWFYSGDRARAINNYEKALEVNPNHLRLLNDIATAYEQNAEPEKAVYYYRKALKITPLLGDANLNLAATYFNMGKPDSAFYFIDKLYFSQSMNKSQNYVSFLPPILKAKAKSIIEMNVEYSEAKNFMPVIENADSLRKIYDKSKTEGISFEECIRMSGRKS